ncbi:MAG: hypothetical protein ACQEVA_08165 [Myxococcota bacterium]
MKTSKTQAVSVRIAARLCVLMCVACLSGCLLGYRYQGVSDQAVNELSKTADVEATGHMIYLGVTLDFRFLRVGTPSMGGNFEVSASNEGGRYGDEYNVQLNGFQLDAPVVSLWSEEEGFGYPGLLEHRHSLDFWLSGTLMPVNPPHWWADASLVYYNHDLLAVRAFGGYGRIPFDGTVSGYLSGERSADMFETTVGGPTFGVELTILAGEQALDFLNWFGDAQNAAADEASGRRR